MNLIDPDILGQERRLYIISTSKDDHEQMETIKEWRRAHSAHDQDGKILCQDDCVISDAKVK